MTIISELIYGISVDFEGLGFTDDDYNEGISWDHSIIRDVREFAYAHDLTPAMSNNDWEESMTDLAIGVPLWKVREARDSNMVCVEKAKVRFEELVKDGLFERLLVVTGHTGHCEPDLHHMVEVR